MRAGHMKAFKTQRFYSLTPAQHAVGACQVTLWHLLTIVSLLLLLFLHYITTVILSTVATMNNLTTDGAGVFVAYYYDYQYCYHSLISSHASLLPSIIDPLWTS